MELNERWHDVTTDRGRMNILVVEPSRSGRYPAIVHFHSFVGISEFRLEAVRRMARLGYVVILPNLFHRIDRHVFYRLPADEEKAVKAAGSLSFVDMALDSRMALNLAREHERVDGSRIGVVGYGMGGTVAFIAAAHHRDVAAAAIFYSRNIVTAATSVLRPLSPLFMIENINCPVLFVAGRGDPVPSPADCEIIRAHFQKHSKKLDVLVHDGTPPTGHAFMEEDIPALFNPVAAAWGWQVQTEFFKSRLNGAAQAA